MSRRKFSVEEMLAILKEAKANGITQTIRRHGIYAKMTVVVPSIAGGSSTKPSPVLSIISDPIPCRFAC